MIALLVGLALMPTAGLALFAAAKALAALAVGLRAAAPFAAGALACLLGRVFIDFEDSAVGGFLRSVYVLGHELSHAAAAWATGGKVFGMKVGKDGGHVDLSHSNPFIALAPYCVPAYTVALIAAYRFWLWLRPDLEAPELYLFLMGASLAFHLIFTFDTIWSQKQPDLAAGGGVVFSLSVIGLVNALVVLLLAKALFPRGVALEESLTSVAQGTRSFWRGLFFMIVHAARR